MSKEERRVPELRFKGFHDEWEQRKVEDIAIVNTGKKDTQDAVTDGAYDFYVRSPKIERINSYSYNGEAVLTVGDGVGVGRVFHYVNGKFDYHQRVYKISDFKNYNSLFFYYYFSDNFKYEARKYNAKTSVDSVRREMITKMNLPDTNLNEQVQVGRFFKEIDNIITLHQRKINILETLKKVYLNVMFPNRSEDIPRLHFKFFNEAWEQRKFSEVFTKLKSYPLSRNVETTTQTGTKYIHYGDIHTKKAQKINNNSNIPYIENKQYEILEKGDIILADASEDYQGIAEPAVIVENTDFKIVAGLHTIALRSNNAIPLYLYYLIKSSSFRKHGYRTGTGMKVFGITADNVLKFESSYPRLEQQLKISKTLDNMDHLITLHQRKLHRLSKIKQVYLNKLFI